MGLRATKRKKRYQQAAINVEGPLLLSLDTSGTYLNVALQKGDEILATHSSRQPFSHGRAVLPAVETLLHCQQLSLEDVAAFGVCLGPGSFTGLRVGLTTIKGLCYATGKPAVGVPAAQVFVAAVAEAGAVGCLIDAKRGEIYSTLYVDGQERLPPQAGTPADGLRRLLDEYPGELTLVGSACPLCRDELVEEGGSRIRIAPNLRHEIDARTLSQVCMQAFAAGATVDGIVLEPLYVGKPPIHKQRN